MSVPEAAPELPETVVDNHFHVSPRGRGEEAVEEFGEAGGTHLFAPPLLPKSYGLEVGDGEGYGDLFEAHLDLIRSFDTDVEVYPLVGVHPAEVPRLNGTLGLEGAVEAAKTGIDMAAELVEDGRAVAIGEVGRPHWNVPEEFVEACDEVLRHCFSRAAELDCAVQLHTERMDGDGIRGIVSMAEEEGMDPKRLVHHFSPGAVVGACEAAGSVPSVLCRSEFLSDASKSGARFLMETDFLDDPERPGAVLGPKTVPSRTRSMLRDGDLTPEGAQRVHRELPEEVYGVEF